MTWNELATFAAQVPPDFADRAVRVRYDRQDDAPPIPCRIERADLDDRGPSLTIRQVGA
jgi:hypothetical protein